MNLDLQHEGRLRPVNSPSLRCRTVSILSRGEPKVPHNARRTVRRDDEKRDLGKEKENLTDSRPYRTWIVIKSGFRYGGHGEEQRYRPMTSLS